MNDILLTNKPLIYATITAATSFYRYAALYILYCHSPFDPHPLYLPLLPLSFPLFLAICMWEMLRFIYLDSWMLELRNAPQLGTFQVGKARKTLFLSKIEPFMHHLVPVFSALQNTVACSWVDPGQCAVCGAFSQ